MFNCRKIVTFGLMIGIVAVLGGCQKSPSQDERSTNVKIKKVGQVIEKSKKSMAVFKNPKLKVYLKKEGQELSLIDEETLEQIKLVKDYTQSTSTHLVYSGNSESGDVVNVMKVDGKEAYIYEEESLEKVQESVVMSSVDLAIETVKKEFPTKHDDFNYRVQTKKKPDDNGDLFYEVERQRRGKKRVATFQVYVSDGSVKRMKEGN